MLTWLSFWSIIFWLVLILIALKPKNFISILFISELTWLVLYTLSVLLGSIYCDITLLSTSFFILGVAGLEFSLGILISILYKNLNESLNIDANNKNNNQSVLDKNFQSPIEKINWN
uniref:Ymf58 n=1 Tax=Tetrahymena rostrata TaxID=5909 RepID=A0A6G5NK24_TETRO|nr:NADH dehydrogenase subunit 4L [Tetrahymena rostrata]QBI37941.1 Ymf58 [Tetrahymena rostrata]URP31132.1 NADH dehydrogenase subunit 4L [Tetrahymena rostrata]